MHRSSRSRLQRAVVLMLSIIAASCVPDPDVVVPPGSDIPQHGVIVVNEGLRFQDNSSLTLYDPATGTVQHDWFARCNPGERLGDTGNDIVVWNGSAFIVASTSQNVEVITLPSGRSRGRVRIGDGDPRKLAVVNDSIAYVTLVNGDAVVRFDPRSLVVHSRVRVGPAPEGIAVARGRVFVANSGYGYLRRNEPGAGTVSVLDASSGALAGTLAPGPNPVAVRADTVRGLVYVQYGMPHADSAGGVVAYDAVSLEERGRWSLTGCGVAGEMALDASRRVMYIVDGRGSLSLIDLAATGSPRLFASTGSSSPLGFFGVGVNARDGRIFASYITQFSLPGHVVVLDADASLVDEFDAGLNPATFGFY